MRTSNPFPAYPAQLDPKIKPIDYLAYMKDELLQSMNSSFETGFTTDVLQKLREKSGYVLTDKQLLSLRRMVEKYKVQEHIDGGYLFAGYAEATAIGKAVAVKSTKMQQANDDEEDIINPDLPDDFRF